MSMGEDAKELRPLLALTSSQKFVSTGGRSFRLRTSRDLPCVPQASAQPPHRRAPEFPPRKSQRSRLRLYRSPWSPRECRRASARSPAARRGHSACWWPSARRSPAAWYSQPSLPPDGPPLRRRQSSLSVRVSRPSSHTHARALACDARKELPSRKRCRISRAFFPFRSSPGNRCPNPSRFPPAPLPLCFPWSLLPVSLRHSAVSGNQKIARPTPDLISAFQILKRFAAFAPISLR